MATLAELSERLLKRFKGVPNITIEDATDWAEEAMLEHGYKLTDSVPSNRISLVLLYAQAEGALRIALSTAHYFIYKDGEESVDKSRISRQYRQLAVDLKAEYHSAKTKAGGSSFRYMKRADRF